VTVDQHSQGTAVQPGAVFGSYRILSEIGRGGMGVVYLAEHTIMGKQAAVKVLLPEYSGREDLLTRFFNEARAAARLHHPAFVEVFDCGVARESAFMVMEYVEGENLTAVLKAEGRLPLAQAVLVARTIAEAMAVAHENEIVHRDLKPDNLILTKASTPGRVGSHPVKILDFGIAKLNLGGGNLRMTKTGMLMGTPLYMSPEQCQGSTAIDRRSDIYSLGCILYAMLTGTPPFQRSGDGIVLIAHIVDSVPPLEEHGVSVPPALEATLMKALAKLPEDRQQSMTELVVELDAAVASPNKETKQGRAVGPSQPPGDPAARASAAVPVNAPASRLSLRRSATPTASTPRTPTPPLGGTTTFSRTSGQVAAVPAGKKGRRPTLWIGVTAGTVLGIVGAVSLTRSVKPRPIAATPVIAVPAPAPPPAPPPAPALAPAPTAQIVLRLDSDPAGARVLRTSDGTVLGTTPLERTVDRGDQELELVIEKRGFRSETLRLRLDADVQRTVTLQRRPRPVVDPDEGRKL
jgi:serine/threonine protein kinase